MAIATLAEQRNIPFVIDVAAMDAITAKGYKNVFRCFPKIELFMVSMGKFLDQIIKEKKGDHQEDCRFQRRRRLWSQPGSRLY